MHRANYEIGSLLTIRSKNPDSYMFHTPAIDIVELQSKALGIKQIIQETAGKKEIELADLKKGLIEAKKSGAQGIITGALYSSYQRNRIEKLCEDLDLKVFSPLWHINQETEMREILDNDFKFLFTKIAADELDKTWLGREISYKDVTKLAALNKKIGLNIAGEGGEFESLVLDMPMFKKRIEILKSDICMESKNTGEYRINEARLVEKG